MRTRNVAYHDYHWHHLYIDKVFHFVTKFIRWFSYHLAVSIWMLLVIGSNDSMHSMRLSHNLSTLNQANQQWMCSHNLLWFPIFAWSTTGDAYKCSDFTINYNFLSLYFPFESEMPDKTVWGVQTRLKMNGKKFSALCVRVTYAYLLWREYDGKFVIVDNFHYTHIVCCR